MAFPLFGVNPASTPPIDTGFDPFKNLLSRITQNSQKSRERRQQRQSRLAQMAQQQAIQGAQNAVTGPSTSGNAGGQFAGGTGSLAGSKTVTNKLGHKIPLTTIKTPGGAKVTINSRYAPQFLGMLTELEKAGYKLNSVGGYANRNVAGTNTASKHAGGYAIDINPQKNPYTTQIGRTEFNPATINSILKKYPMFEWGGNWKGARKDYMHFSVREKFQGYSGL